MYRGLMIVEQAEEAKVFTRSDIAKNKFRFNYIYTGMDYPGSRVSGLRSEGMTPEKPVPSSKVENLGDLMVWLYGKTVPIRLPHPFAESGPQDARYRSLTEAGIKASRDGLPLSVAHDIGQGDERYSDRPCSRQSRRFRRRLGTLTTGFNPDDAGHARCRRGYREPRT